MKIRTLKEMQNYIAQNWVTKNVSYWFADALKKDRYDPELATLALAVNDYERFASEEGWKVGGHTDSFESGIDSLQRRLVVYNPINKSVYNREENCVDNYVLPEQAYSCEQVEFLCRNKKYYFTAQEGVTFYVWRKLCKKARISVEKTDANYWIVTEPLAQKLIAMGECVDFVNHDWIWGRQSTDLISDERVIEEIAREWID